MNEPESSRFCRETIPRDRSFLETARVRCLSWASGSNWLARVALPVATEEWSTHWKTLRARLPRKASLVSAERGTGAR